MNLESVTNLIMEMNSRMKEYATALEEKGNIVVVKNSPLYSQYEELLSLIAESRLTLRDVVLRLVYLELEYNKFYQVYEEMKVSLNFMDDFEPHNILTTICNKDQLLENLEAFDEEGDYTEEMIVDYILLTKQELDAKYATA
ncbi:hypothetical protein [Tumebacillus permanentifrigoris]|uniref:Uncharacterized protein n=1 Tax=Tumebacillus permanentifrigoris TaxID=378543 RepID=A0A316D8T2_9BACL|nr:hypothetical protein [Tumebacillus permanentifrigoris]PWK11475.1 hypothetical protein C7459_1103 [Tumebacillus permanentifrigoris]